MTSKTDFKVMILLLVSMQLTHDLFAIAKFLYKFLQFDYTNLNSVCETAKPTSGTVHRFRDTGKQVIERLFIFVSVNCCEMFFLLSVIYIDKHLPLDGMV